MEYNNDELYHYGRLGMKWGQHIYGRVRSSSKRTAKTQTKASKELKSGKKKLVLFKKKASNKVKQFEKQHEQKTEEQKKQEIAEKKQKVLKSRSPKMLYENADLFSDQELQAAYNRLVIERNIANLSPKEVSKGEKFVNNTIKVTRTTSSLLESGTKIYNSVAKIYNATPDGSSKPLPIVGSNEKKKKDND